MRLKRMYIKNFRSIRDASIDLWNQTVFIGANGTGKSTALLAIERFYAPSATIQGDDFFARDLSVPIEIALTFTDFNESEIEKFASRIHDNEMTVVRVFEATGGKTNGRYYGMTLQFPEFSAVRAATGAQPKRAAYTELREKPEFAEFPTVTRADDIEPILQQWEAEHSNQCFPVRDDGQFFGFTNVARGNLQKATAFVFIPAVREASVDAMDSRGAAIAQLVELLVRSAVQRRADIKKFQAKISAEFRELTDPKNIKELDNLSLELTKTLQLFYGESTVDLQWQAAEDFALPLPYADVFLSEDGFRGPVDRKGHGLQRALILTLLQHLAKAVSERVENESDSTSDTQVDEHKNQLSSAVEIETQPMPGLILAIEEPELYQHPTKQRHFVRVLAQLSEGSLPGVATQTQIIFASHSSLFVSVDRFDEIRLARRFHEAGIPCRDCRFTQASLATVVDQLTKAWNKNEGDFTVEGIRARLHIIGPEIAEGFFADIVVLVEGPSDRAAILAAAKLCKVDLGSLGIAVLEVGGKTNIDKVAAVFLALGIPIYVIWDCDCKNGAIDKVEFNQVFQKLLGEENVTDAETRIRHNYACFKQKLEVTLKEEIGEKLYLTEIEKAKKQYGIEKNDAAEKTPAVMAQVFLGAENNGKRSWTLDKIINAIVQLRKTFTIDDKESAKQTS